MPELIPFAALRYTRKAGDMSVLLAPPYDVIDVEQAAELRARSPHNSVRLILPEGPPDSRYDDAAHTLEAWIADGVLACEDTPGAYVYRQTFDVHGKETTRHALFCAVRLSEFSEGQVLPHERTHAGPKQDRLALTRATRAQLSPIFMISRDTQGEALGLTVAATDDEPAFSVHTPDGIGHELWVVDGEAALALCEAAGAEALLIADGHHRYETALAAMAELHDSAEASYLLVCVVSQRDPGLIVQPTHRVLSAGPLGDPDFDWIGSLRRVFELEHLGDVGPIRAESIAASRGGGALVVMPAQTPGEAWLAVPRGASRTHGVNGAMSQRLAPVVFDALVLGALFHADADSAAHAGYLTYAREPQAALDAAAPKGCAFMLPPVALDDVWDTATAGHRLPQKSTYFEPKIPSGLVFRAL